MAQRYIAAIENSDIYARKVLNKHFKKRPLGHIENSHRYVPPQPVLSCRTVNVDVCGTRTYRARSTEDIIDEQQKLIHEQYIRRTATSAPPVRNRTYSVPESRPDSTTPKQRPNSSLEVSGTGQQVVRPGSSPEARPLKRKRELGLKRPKSTSYLQNAKSVTETFMRIKIDPELVKRHEEYRETTTKIHEQWLPENHDIQDGIYKRGDASARLEAPTSWLIFGGGEEEETASGVIDAFAAMKNDDEYYSIEGDTGSRVARQLRKGEKIRIGRNGEVLAHDLRVKKWKKHDEKKEKIDAKETESLLESKPQPIAPISFEDAMTKPGFKVLTCSKPKAAEEKLNLNETHPVVFHKLNQDEPVTPRPVVRNKGFQIKQRNKLRRKLDGRQSPSITEISIDKNTVDDDKLSNVSYDDIISQRSSATSSRKLQRDAILQQRMAEMQARNAYEQRMPKPIHEQRRSPSPPRGYGARSPSPNRDLRSPSKISIAESLQTIQTGDFQRPRPMTSCSIFSGAGDPDLNVISPGLPRPQPIERVRSTKGTRPPLAKPLHLAGAGTGASISSHGMKGEPEYIKITQQIAVNAVKPGSPSPTTSRKINQNVINSVSDMNRNEFQTSPHADEFELHLSGLPDYSIHSKRKSSHSPTTPMMSPASSIKSHDSKKFAVNIPTAESGSCSDINSLSDFNDQDFQSHPNLPSVQETINEVQEGDGKAAQSESQSKSQLDPLNDNTIDTVTNMFGVAAIAADESGPAVPPNSSREATDMTEDDIPRHITSIEVSSHTKELLEDVTKDAISNESAPLVAKIVAENQKQEEEVKNPKEELEILRQQIKSDLQKTQEEAQSDIQDLYMKQHAQ